LTFPVLKCIINFNVIVCLCHPTSDRDVDAIIDEGARTVEDIGRRCGAGTGCGACVGELHEPPEARADRPAPAIAPNRPSWSRSAPRAERAR
jgi:bacterioferritin-associated ferredoxin